MKITTEQSRWTNPEDRGLPVTAIGGRALPIDGFGRSLTWEQEEREIELERQAYEDTLARFEANPEAEPSWDDLVAVEIRLRDIEYDARRFAYEDDKNKPDQFCANEVWYGYGRYRDRGLKARYVQLVGSCVPAFTPRFLRSEQAYDVGYHYLYDLLPGCRRCGCF